MELDSQLDKLTSLSIKYSIAQLDDEFTTSSVWSNLEESMLSPDLDQLLRLSSLTSQHYLNSTFNLEFLDVGSEANSTLAATLATTLDQNSHSEMSVINPQSQNEISDLSIQLGVINPVESRIDQLTYEDARLMNGLVCMWSRVAYSGNPKRINLFTVEAILPRLNRAKKINSNIVNYKQLNRYLLDCLYFYSHGESLPSLDSLPKLAKIIELYLHLISIPGSSSLGLINDFPISWTISIIRRIVENLSLDEVQSSELNKSDGIMELSSLVDEQLLEIKNSLISALLLLLRLIVDTSQLESHKSDYFNILGALTVIDPLGGQWEYPLRELAYNVWDWLLKNDTNPKFGFDAVFPYFMKWTYYNLTSIPQPAIQTVDSNTNKKVKQPNNQQRAKQFLVSIATLPSEYNRLDQLLQLLKYLCVKFVDKAEVRKVLVPAIAELLVSLAYVDRQYLLENLFKDCLRSPELQVRSLTLEIFATWFKLSLPSTLDFTHASGMGLHGHLEVLLSSIVLRFNDRVTSVKAKAMSTYLLSTTHLLSLVKSSATQPDSTYHKFLKSLVAYVLIQSSDLKFLNMLKKRLDESNSQVVKLAIQILIQLSQMLYDANLSQHLTNELRIYVITKLNRLVALQAMDTNHVVRKSAVRHLGNLIHHYSSFHQQMYEDGEQDLRTICLSAAFQDWYEVVLPTAYDPEKQVVDEMLGLLTPLLYSLPECPWLVSCLSKRLEPLHFRSLGHVMALVVNRRKILSNSTVELSTTINLLDNADFLNTLISLTLPREPTNPGLWQLLATISAYNSLKDLPIAQHINPFLTKLLDLAVELKVSTDYGDIDASEQFKDLIVIGEMFFVMTHHWFVTLDSDFIKNEISIELQQTVLQLTEAVGQLQIPTPWLLKALQLLERFSAYPVLTESGWFNVEEEDIKIAKQLVAGGEATFVAFGHNLSVESQALIDRLNLPINATNDQQISLDPEDVALLTTAIASLGEIGLLLPKLDYQHTFYLLLQVVGRIVASTANHEKPVYLYPSQLRANAFVALGKLALGNEALAREVCPMLAVELDFKIDISSDLGLSNCVAHLLSPVILTLTDLCHRYAHIVDPYVPILAKTLFYPNSQVRQSGLLALLMLLRSDRIKLRPHLYLLLTAAHSLESDPEVRRIFDLGTVQVLMVKMPNLLFETFPDLIKFVNGGFRPPQASEFTANLLQTSLNPFLHLKDINQARAHRHRCFKLVLNYLTPDLKFRLPYLLITKLIQPFIDLDQDVNDERFELAILADTLHVLSSDEIQLKLPSEHEIDDLEDDDSDPFDSHLLSQLTLRNVTDNLLPSLARLKLRLDNIESPLQPLLIRCITRLVLSAKLDLLTLTKVVGTNLAKVTFQDITDMYALRKKTNKRKANDARRNTPKRNSSYEIANRDQLQFGLQVLPETDLTNDNNEKFHRPNEPFKRSRDGNLIVTPFRQTPLRTKPPPATRPDQSQSSEDLQLPLITQDLETLDIDEDHISDSNEIRNNISTPKVKLYDKDLETDLESSFQVEFDRDLLKF